MDRVNGQLDKVDRITDSAVDAADSVDTAVRAVSLAITRPVQKVSGFAAGVSFGAADFKARRDWRHAVQAGKEAAARRESDLARRAAGRGNVTTEEIRLVIPAEEDFRPIAHLVTGGLAMRLDVTYDDLDDLQVGIEALLALRDDADELVVSLSADDGVLHASLGPFAPETVHERRARTTTSTCTASSRPSATRTRSRSATAARGSS